MHAVVRIDEVEKEGEVKITEVKGAGTGANITKFPQAGMPPPGNADS